MKDDKALYKLLLRGAIIIFILGAFIHSAFPQDQESAKILILLRNPIITCHSCQFLIENFVRTIKNVKIKNILYGIYIPIENSNITIQEKQISRYIKVNNFDFPMVIDYWGIIKGGNYDKYDIIVIKGSRIAHFKLPLRIEDWDVLNKL
jgi:hypothetical protein